MAKYFFFQDVKITAWERRNFCVEAESKEQAIALAHKYCHEDVIDDEELIDSDILGETIETLPVSENDGQPTIEVFDKATRKCVGSNAEKFDK